MRRITAAITIGLILGLGIVSFFQVRAASSQAGLAERETQDWPVYNGPGGDHYSSLRQINRKNVRQLKVAWMFDTGEQGGLESNPLIIGNVLYGNTPSGKVVALNAATGKLIWKFDPGVPGRVITRGLAYWTDGHDRRLFAGVRNFLYAIDAKTGKGIPSFGEDGRIDLRKGLRGDYRQQSVSLTSPGVVYKNLIIVCGANPETHPAPPGDIRAFDVRTGALRWTFHTIPRPGEFGYDTWPTGAWKDAGAANNWAGMTVDVKRGIVYAPTGSAVADFYGGDRVGNDLFADTLLALDAETGKRIWHFQGVHHDLWDRDFPAPPVLLTVKRNGREVDAVAQTTKSGFVFLFNRTNGKPLFPIKESHYPASTVPGEVASPTQPLPTIPAPYTHQFVNAETLTNRTPQAHAWAEKQLASYISGGQFIPPSLNKLTVDMPGFAGGGEWGGAAVDPRTGVLYVNANDTAWVVGLIVFPKPGSEGEEIYQTQCSVCHGINRFGSPPAFPRLVGIDTKLTDQEIADKIHQGGGRMPPFTNINGEQMKSLIQYLKTPPQWHRPHRNGKAAAPARPAITASRKDMPYETIGFRRFLDPEGYPATAPPWGTLSAIDMNTGRYLWEIPFGEYPELAAKGMKDTGSDNYGGPVVTAGGLIFIGATVFDQEFHAYDSTTGKLLWETELPLSGLATPATYMVNGKQYVVIGAGGGQTSRKPSGGMYIAFSLP